MAARLLDGVAVANQIRAEVAPGVEAFRARAGRPARARYRAGRGGPGLADLRARKAEVGGGGGPAGRPRDAARFGNADGPADRRRSVEQERRRTTASWCSRRCPARWALMPSGAFLTRSGRTRTSTGFIRSTWAGWSRIARISSRARRRASSSCSSVTNPDCRSPRGRHRPERHRRQADGACCCCIAMRR